MGTKKEQFLALTVSLSLDLLSLGVIYDNNTTSNTAVKIHQSEKYQMKCLLKGTEKTKEEEKELQEAGVAPLQWNGICKLARLEQDDASIEKRLPYSGLRNTLRNDCMSGTGSRGRQEWVDLLRIVRNKPMTLKHRHLPEPFRTTFNVVQSTLVLMSLSPTSILHCLLPTLCISVLFSLTHVPRTLTEDEIEKRNKKKEINKKLKGGSK